MKMKKYLIVLLAVIITLVSCNIEMLPEGESVNEYIFPYMTFTLSGDGTYYTASVIKGVPLESVFVPAYVAHDGSSIPVKYFDGFKNPNDASALRTIRLESSSTEITTGAVITAVNLVRIEIEIIEPGAKWGELPVIEKEGMEFLGWFVDGTGDVVESGDALTSTNSRISPRWSSHKYVHHEAKEPTCTEKGWYEYDTCENCDYTTYRERPALGHSTVHHEKVDATCTEEGTREYWECSRCHKFFSESSAQYEISTLTIPPKGHSTYYVDEKKATCGIKGVEAHWECSRCHTLFSDEGGTTEVTEKDLEIEALEHKWKRTEYSTTDKCVWYECELCHATKDAAGHKWDDGVVMKEATASESGKKKYTCSICDTEKYEDIEPLSTEHTHEWTVLETVAATCTTRGYTVRECSVCGVTYRCDYKDPTGHTMTQHAPKDPTCLESGNINYYYSCSVCGKLFIDANGINETTLEEVQNGKGPLGHKFSDDYTKDSSFHWHKCIRCDETDGKVGHSYTEKKTESEYLFSDATCTSPALYYYSCVCGAYTTEKTFESGDALGHDPVHHNLQPANCGYPGTKEYWECSRCKRKFQDEACTKPFGNDDELVIPATGEHTLESYQSMGTSGHIAQCSVCHKTYGDTVPHTIDTVNWKDDATSHWHACQYCDYKADNATHTYEDFGTDTICTICHRVKDESETTTDGGFDIKPENLEPRGKLTVSGGNGSFKATFKLDEGSQMTKIKWYLDNVLLEDETALSCSFNAPEKQTYHIMCVVFNSSLVNSYEQTVEGGGTP